MDDAARAEFDALVEVQVAELPYTVQLLLEETPLIVEDHPSDALLQELGLSTQESDELCGVYCGLGMLERSVDDSFTEPETITIFRRGIRLLAESQVDDDQSLEELLRKEIRITILHEIGHHFGLDEDDLEAIGYA
ncbi:MAG: neutral zinc metallopeptidase [Phycisphaerae bacterium]|nr:neutral zinc metallopeptidase [Phycisphaerae bacterium]HAW95686.1 neutral zinc metallopeptidase [Phycisphaerales bacterium]